MEKMPPKEKIYEAFSAIADGRVRMGEGEARVLSSDRSSAYTVTWRGEEYRSNDNATYWQGYAGYPVIAVLLLQGELPFDAHLAQYFAGIAWKTLNRKHKRRYGDAAAEAFDSLPCGDAEKKSICDLAEQIYSALRRLPVTVRRGGRRAGGVAAKEEQGTAREKGRGGAK